jgi:hypothetical protein
MLDYNSKQNATHTDTVDGELLGTNGQDKLIELVQSSTRTLLGSFKDKTELLTKCPEIKLLLREGYDIKIAKQAAENFFGSKKKMSFIAIDGTESQDQQLDMLIFYVGAFGYSGQLEFLENGCTYDEILQAGNVSNISAAIPLYEEDASSIVGQVTEGGIEVEPERLPSILMHFAEYYMAVRAVQDNPDLKVVILDRTLAGDVGHLIWSVSELLNEKKCVLDGIETEFGTVTPLDLELARILHPNDKLQIPAPRSQFIKYSAINCLLMSTGGEGKSTLKGLAYEEILEKMGANNARLNKLANDLTRFNERFSFLKKEPESNGLSIEQKIGAYWQRVFSAALKIAQHIFDPGADNHPLIYEQSVTNMDNGNEYTGNRKNRRWITSADLEYMTLIMIYALLRMAWERNVLVIGLIKDVAAGELIKTVVPILRNSHMIDAQVELPTFSSDKQLLQTNSVINGESVTAPWRTFEFDACFRTMAPVLENINEYENKHMEKNQARVTGAYKNVISGERMFVKSYIQLWQSKNDTTVRSHVFSYDRPCYPGLDIPGELLLFHHDGKVDEEIRPMIHFHKDCELSYLVMDILCSMASEVIPECLGHNYPLFLADKKAKYVLQEMKTAYMSTVAFEMANSELDQQVLFEAKYREFRSKMENSRRAKR